MKFTPAIFAAVVLTAAFAASAGAQQQQPDNNMQVEQLACQDDVYALCGEAIPDQQRIEKCLRKNLSKVSHKCRDVMASFRKRHRGHRGD